MSYKFVKDELVHCGECMPGSERFDIDEEVGMYAVGPDEVFALRLSCGDPDKVESWRSFEVEFEKLMDYNLFRQLLCRAYSIRVS